MSKECTTTANLDTVAADKLEEMNWWDSLSSTDHDILTRARPALPSESDRVTELAVALWRQSRSKNDAWGIGEVVKTVDGTRCQQSLLRGAIRIVARRVVARQEEASSLAVAV